jgi:two-component system sensor histidine kinase CpxA
MVQRGRGGSYGQRIAGALVVLLAGTLLAASMLYSRTGRGAAEIELARLAYTQASRVAAETERTLSAQGTPTPSTPTYLSRAAFDLDASLVLFLEADTPLAVAHGPSLNRALGRLRDHDAQGSFDDSGQTPWVPTFSDAPDPDRFPRRGGRIVRVQTTWPYAVEAPVAGNMTLRLVPLSLLPIEDGGYRSALFVLFIVMSLLGVLLALQLARPVESAAAALERMASSGVPWAVPIDGLKEIGWIGRAATRLRQRALDAETQQREVLRSLDRILVEPIGRVRAGIAGLSGAKLSADQRTTLAEVERETGSVHRTVSALWQWSSLEAGSLDADLKDVDLRRTLSEVVRLFKERRAPDLQIEVTVADDVDETLRMDPTLMAGVLAALLDNVRLFGEGPVAIDATRAHTKIEIIVRDSGPGVPYEQLGTIFEPFAPRPDNARRGGLGLGLRLARLILGLHRGGLTVRNHPTAGFEVAMWLPAPPVRVSVVDKSLLGADWVQNTGERTAVKRPTPGPAPDEPPDAGEPAPVEPSDDAPGDLPAPRDDFEP